MLAAWTRPPREGVAMVQRVARREARGSYSRWLCSQSGASERMML